MNKDSNEDEPFVKFIIQQRCLLEIHGDSTVIPNSHVCVQLGKANKSFNGFIWSIHRVYNMVWMSTQVLLCTLLYSFYLPISNWYLKLLLLGSRTDTSFRAFIFNFLDKTIHLPVFLVPSSFSWFWFIISYTKWDANFVYWHHSNVLY